MDEAEAAVTLVRAPVLGRVLPLSAVPDPVFARALAGPGLAVDPPRDGPLEALAPVAGLVLAVHAHAFVVAGPGGTAVLVHLGVDTVRLRGKGFELLVDQGDTVETGQPVVRWDPGAVAAGGRSPLVPVLALDTSPEQLDDPASGTVAAGDALFTRRHVVLA